MELHRGFRVGITLSFVLISFSMLLHTTSARNGHGESCSSDYDCEKEYKCHSSRVCDCAFNVGVDRSRTNTMFYDYDLKICFSHIGKMCTMPSTAGDRLPSIPCVPNAYCHRRSYDSGPTTLGVCRCNPGYESLEDNKKCLSISERRAHTVTSMDQVKHEGWNIGRGTSPLRGTMSMVVSNIIIWLYYVLKCR